MTQTNDLDGKMQGEAWIGVDLDGTLAEYSSWKGETHIGKPIPKMVYQVLNVLNSGMNVKIFTARWHNGENQIKIIQDWLERCGLPRLEVTATKDFSMVELWDDRCMQIITNTGERVTNYDKG